MARHINLFSLKGGQGVTTTAVLLARKFSSEGYTVLLADRNDGDLPAMLGYGDKGSGVTSVSPMISLVVGADLEDHAYGHDVIISDLGTFVEGAENYLVIHPDYVSLRRAMKHDGVRTQCKGVIIVRPADRVLTDRDVTSVLDLPHIATINMSVDVARMSDAGVLLTRNGLFRDEIAFPVTEDIS